MKTQLIKRLIWKYDIYVVHVQTHSLIYVYVHMHVRKKRSTHVACTHARTHARTHTCARTLNTGRCYCINELFGIGICTSRPTADIKQK